MSRPTDIPQDVWVKADEAFDLMLCNCREASGSTEQFRIDSIEPLARAILAERERCEYIARNLPVGELHMSNETDLKVLWRRAGNVQAGAIAQAILGGES